jgi:uncharacterized protein (DUF488 family)
MLATIATIGVYGFTAESFAAALQRAEVDTLCDIRRRRGVRGRDHAFANSKRLQALLADLGIRYLHDLTLAPPQTIRAIQAGVDEAGRVTRRKRTTLSPAFEAAYEHEVLGRFELAAFLTALPPDARVVALLCVERDPAACHRSLAATYLSDALHIPVLHIRP